MMNAAMKLRRDPLVRVTYSDLLAKVQDKKRITCEQTKRYLAGVLAKYFDQDGSFLYDLGDSARKKAD